MSRDSRTPPLHGDVVFESEDSNLWNLHPGPVGRGQLHSFSMTEPVLPTELLEEIGCISADVARDVRRRPTEDAPFSTVVRRGATLRRTKAQMNILVPLADVGGSFGKGVRRNTVWKELATDQGAFFVGSEPTPSDYADLALEFHALAKSALEDGVHLVPIKCDEAPAVIITST